MVKIRGGDMIILCSQEFSKANYPMKKSKEPPLLSKIEKHLDRQQAGHEMFHLPFLLQRKLPTFCQILPVKKLWVQNPK